MSELKKKSLTGGQLGAIVGAVVASLLVTAGLGWSITCPCDFTPGGLLFGDRAGEEVMDWSFANDVSLCQIQVGGLLPYSVNLNCMATSSGDLYLSCSVCDRKRWARRGSRQRQGQNATGRDRVPGHRDPGDGRG